MHVPGMRAAARARGAFTLVELVVVVGILAVVCGLLLPATGKAREQARRAQCASNIRQICLAAIRHSQEHERGYYVVTRDNEVDTFESLYPRYVKDLNLFVCPSTHNSVRTPADLRDNARGGRNGTTGHSYEIRGWADAGRRFPDGAFFGAKTLKNWRQFKNGSTGGLIFDADDDTESDTNNWPSVADNHGAGGYNVGFMDGHVEFLPPGRRLLEAYLEGYYDPAISSSIYAKYGVARSGNTFTYTR